MASSAVVVAAAATTTTRAVVVAATAATTTATNGWLSQICPPSEVIVATAVVVVATAPVAGLAAILQNKMCGIKQLSYSFLRFFVPLCFSPLFFIFGKTSIFPLQFGRFKAILRFLTF